MSYKSCFDKHQPLPLGGQKACLCRAVSPTLHFLPVNKSGLLCQGFPRQQHMHSTSLISRIVVCWCCGCDACTTEGQTPEQGVMGVHRSSLNMVCVCVCADTAPHLHPEEIHIWKTHPGQAGEVLHEEWSGPGSSLRPAQRHHVNGLPLPPLRPEVMSVTPSLSP